MSTEKKDDSEKEQDFHGAALIDQDGKEVLITEEMVQDACHKLDEKEPSEPQSES